MSIKYLQKKSLGLFHPKYKTCTHSCFCSKFRRFQFSIDYKYQSTRALQKIMNQGETFLKVSTRRILVQIHYTFLRITVLVQGFWIGLEKFLYMWGCFKLIFSSLYFVLSWCIMALIFLYMNPSSIHQQNSYTFQKRKGVILYHYKEIDHISQDVTFIPKKYAFGKMTEIFISNFCH